MRHRPTGCDLKKGHCCLVRQKSIRVNAVCVRAADALLCASVQWHFHITVSNAMGSCSSVCRCVRLGTSLTPSGDRMRGVKSHDLGMLVQHGICTYMCINTQSTFSAVIHAHCLRFQVATASGKNKNRHLSIWSFPTHPFFPSCLHSIPSLLSRSLHLPRFPNSLSQICLPWVYVSISILRCLTTHVCPEVCPASHCEASTNCGSPAGKKLDNLM